MEALILFDGVCNLCNGAVNFIIDQDDNEKFKFTALQSKTGLALKEKYQINEQGLQSIILIENDSLFMKSSAVLRIAKHLSFPWSIFYIFIIIPSFLGDMCYDFVAKNRYRWFGKKDQCRIATPELRNRFI